MPERDPRREPPAAPQPGDRGTAPAPVRAPDADAARAADAAPAQPVVVQGRPLAGAPAAPQAPPHPYTGPSATIPGGVYGRNVKVRGDQHYGGELVDAHGNVLATFEDDQVNTGNPEDGKKPEGQG